ncbi:MSMEG_0565 family glycosyltransferase [Robbsia sp. Bb-Pol-6]|uniref:MSMEG_0565 family glycosyltransferase n=1 Tax=Robbsia betulipollinis TaxID=2981849 RepID=A0ABT3ZTS9_9BURK|nr:MSMEG_0565 family glycosyltransferase [Robbsia betulipollinis]MCY0389642.1 MSMEG_0565 family glycosyltransferase [Robbsia betulipollinis]
MTTRPLRICLLTHSTLPRGGVVHALELGDALADAGHCVSLCAPDADRAGLFRAPRAAHCRFVAVPATPVDGPLPALVEQRIADWLRYFDTTPGALEHDIFHAQDSISANALATLVERGRIRAYVRTVHHLDRFADARLDAWQTRGFAAARQVLCVSEGWRQTLRRDHGIDAEVVGNGVDRRRFSPRSSAADAVLARRLGMVCPNVMNDPGGMGGLGGPDAAPRLLSVGGVEARKNTLTALAAFVRVRERWPQARWWIAGGASLLDHGAYAARFRAAVAAAGLTLGPDAPIVPLGRVDDAAMPALFRLADALLFPSLTEGFGLVVLEALASGTPAVVSRIAPFTEYLDDAAVEWALPEDAASIAAALARALDAAPARAAARREAGFAVCARYGWPCSARTHVHLYRAFRGALPAAAGAADIPGDSARDVPGDLSKELRHA